jgi:hypothetical protein
MDEDLQNKNTKSPLQASALSRQEQNRICTFKPSLKEAETDHKL